MMKLQVPLLRPLIHNLLTFLLLLFMPTLSVGNISSFLTYFSFFSNFLYFQRLSVHNLRHSYLTDCLIRHEWSSTSYQEMAKYQHIFTIFNLRQGHRGKRYRLSGRDFLSGHQDGPLRFFCTAFKWQARSILYHCDHRSNNLLQGVRKLVGLNVFELDITLQDKLVFAGWILQNLLKSKIPCVWCVCEQGESGGVVSQLLMLSPTNLFFHSTSKILKKLILTVTCRRTRWRGGCPGRWSATGRQNYYRCYWGHRHTGWGLIPGIGLHHLGRLLVCKIHDWGKWI